MQDLQFGDETLTQDLRRSISVAMDSLVGFLADSHEFLTMMTYDGEGHFGENGTVITIVKFIAVLAAMTNYLVINVNVVVIILLDHCSLCYN